jgi:hypothetical protein
MLNSVNFSMAHNGKKILATTEHYILISLWSPTFFLEWLYAGLSKSFDL